MQVTGGKHYFSCRSLPQFNSPSNPSSPAGDLPPSLTGRLGTCLRANNKPHAVCAEPPWSGWGCPAVLFHSPDRREASTTSSKVDAAWNVQQEGVTLLHLALKSLHAATAGGHTTTAPRCPTCGSRPRCTLLRHDHFFKHVPSLIIVALRHARATSGKARDANPHHPPAPPQREKGLCMCAATCTCAAVAGNRCQSVSQQRRTKTGIQLSLCPLESALISASPTAQKRRLGRP